MGLGIVGLGGMGTGMVQRLMNVGHQCVVYDLHSVTVQTLATQDVPTTSSLEGFVNSLSRPRALWVMAPAVEVDFMMNGLIPFLDGEDIVIDAGSKSYSDGADHVARLKAKGVHYVHIGAESKANAPEQSNRLKIGGNTPTFLRRAPAYSTSDPLIDVEAHAPGRGKKSGVPTFRSKQSKPTDAKYVEIGAGGVVEVVPTAAYTPVMTIHHHEVAGIESRALHEESEHLPRYEVRDQFLKLDETTEVWRRGAVISSWILDLAARVLSDGEGPDKFAASVSESDEGRWTVIAAIDDSVPAPVLTAAIYERFGPRREAGFADKVLSALRISFGGQLDVHTMEIAR